ncbi:Putative uncharacterized protein [Moritella viscosa]|uniref:O-antigen polymerase n=1 Tax=Moritella viscosa TaxID=80854 RepID=A0A1K9Z2S7_9GAMM|nr:hypothetical protein [Moritella viscosa]SGY90193.1 Putative uncharacterized protein [Moritella viscosa]SGY98661.1 Putative uncharacterized protein [Moritella viscosa]SHO05399.1 Putative uncharacterized protein [Moritella viscosa]SHO05400.1 Putative uncharacterized protein [Moritella viscosa]SHO06294.1 Putative uncharacterized protein [Moritella viscosa]
MNILLNVTLFSMLFPWISFGILKLDTQPWFIIMGSIFFFFNIRKKLHSAIFLSLFLFLYACCIGIAYGHFDLLTARAILSYYAFFIVLSSYYIIKRYFEVPIWVITVSNFIWLCAGALQVVFGKDILSFLVYVRTTEDRGVTGLAPEPTFYGIFLFFMCWLLYLEKSRIPTRIFQVLFYLNMVFILFVAKSSMVILFILISVILYVFFNLFSIRKLIITFLSLVVGAVLIIQFGSLLEGSRLFKLVILIIDSPLIILAEDASMNERASHIFFSFKAFIDDAGLPHGFHLFSNILTTGRADYGGLFWWGGAHNKVMSGVGSVLFELGWFSLLFFILIFWLMVFRNHLKNSLYFFFLLLGLFMSAIPVAFTLLPIIIISTHFNFIERERNAIKINY